MSTKKKAPGNKTPSTAAATPQQQPPPPNWPLISLPPRTPFQPLNLETLVPSQILTIPNFWTAKLCKTYVSFLKTLPLATTPGKPKKGHAVRVNDRFQIEDAQFAERLWVETGLRECVVGGDGEEEGMSVEERRELWGGEVVGLNPNIRIYRYSKGQFFDCHYDDTNLVTLPTKPVPTPARTTWTILLYLTSPATGCIGGETAFYLDENNISDENAVVVGLETGMLLLHKHGSDCLLHEGREVKEGEKWVIRSDLCVRR
ncbi:hypothetical protein F5884DRAFT_487377 [Xylogone sp. PMI_703]|nr:hypothetical protein F5884DRAFT_487377 [Xylogone sp. PMI_703]